MEAARARVLEVFEEKFPEKDFDLWNGHIDDDAAERIIDNCGIALFINIDKFIRDLE